MKLWLTTVTDYAVVLIDGMALIIVLMGTLGAFIGAIRFSFTKPSGHERRQLWLRYSRWLVAGLTFQLAADILESSIATDWQSVGRLAAIAFIRTFLNYFLERDVAEISERETSKDLTAPT
jgi:uncharacterized membrane protein